MQKWGNLTFYLEPDAWVYDCGHANSWDGEDHDTQMLYHAKYGRDLCDFCMDEDLIRYEQAADMILRHLGGRRHRQDRLQYLAEKLITPRRSVILDEWDVLWYSRNDLEELFDADEQAEYRL